MAGLTAIRQHDPALDEVGLVAETRRIVAAVQEAMNQGDPGLSRGVMGDAAWDEQRLRITDLHGQGRRHAVDNLVISDVRITDAHTDGVIDTVTARVRYAADEHDVDLRSGHDAPGAFPARTTHVESWILQRPATSVTPVPGATMVRCPTCGATLAAGTAVCAYCHQPVPAGGGWRVTLIAPATPTYGMFTPPATAPLNIETFTAATAAVTPFRRLGIGGCIGLVVGGLGLLAGIIVPIVIAVHNSSSSSDSGAGGSIFPDPQWSGKLHISGGYELKDTAFTSAAGQFDLTCAQLTNASPNPSITDAVPDIDVTLTDKTRILITTPMPDAPYTGPATYTFGAVGTGSIDVDVQLQGDTRNSLLYTNENPQASTTVVIKADGSGSVTFTHLNDPFSTGKPNEFVDGGFSWTCSQKS